MDEKIRETNDRIDKMIDDVNKMMGDVERFLITVLFIVLIFWNLYLTYKIEQQEKMWQEQTAINASTTKLIHVLIKE